MAAAYGNRIVPIVRGLFPESRCKSLRILTKRSNAKIRWMAKQIVKRHLRMNSDRVVVIVVFVVVTQVFRRTQCLPIVRMTNLNTAIYIR
jgi:hypothetical protein